jgi:chromosome segregation ATPase
VEIESLTQEFSERLGSLEKKYQAAVRERDMFKKQLAKQIDLVGNEQKDQEIAELKSEGIKLQEKILTLEQTVKKLRQTKKEDDKITSQLKAELDTATSSLASATSKIQALSVIEKKFVLTFHVRECLLIHFLG